jgi:hypothetical protein
MPDTGAPGTRSCTADFKIAVVGKWLKAHGATADTPATVAIGFSTDEAHRANRKRAQPYERPVFPLLELGLSRQDCINVIRRAGLPVPPKSACFFCPFHRPTEWQEMRRTDPELFDRAQLLEDTLNERRDTLGKDRCYLTRYGRRLSKAIDGGQGVLFEGDGVFADGACDEGACWT